MRLLIAILLFPAMLSAQDFWRDFTTNGALPFVSGFADGSVEAVKWHYHEVKAKHPGLNDQYWDPAISWKNKYKDWDAGDYRPAYPGAKTWAVAGTDFYHLGRAVQRSSLMASAGIQAATFETGQPWYTYVFRFAVQFISYSVGFRVAYEMVWR